MVLKILVLMGLDIPLIITVVSCPFVVSQTERPGMNAA